MGLETPFRFLALRSERLVLLQRAEEGGGAGEEPLLEGHQHEVGGELLGVVLGSSPAAVRRTA